MCSSNSAEIKASREENLIAYGLEHDPEKHALGPQPEGGSDKDLELELGSRHSPMCKCTSWMRHLAQARNPYSLSWLWIPGSRFARPGMMASELSWQFEIRIGQRMERAVSVRVGAAVAVVIFVRGVRTLS